MYATIKEPMRLDLRLGAILVGEEMERDEILFRNIVFCFGVGLFGIIALNVGAITSS